MFRQAAAEITGLNCLGLFTFRHCAGADVRCHAAAGRVSRVVARMDLNLVAGEVPQVGDDSGLFGVDRYHCLGAFEGFLVLFVRDVGALGRAGGGGVERVRSVGDAHHGTSLSWASRRGRTCSKCFT